MGTFTNSEYPDEMPLNRVFIVDKVKKMQYFFEL